MSTENEGTAAPAAPSVPPVPDAAPDGTPASAPREAAYEQPSATEGYPGQPGHPPAPSGQPTQPGQHARPAQPAQPGYAAQDRPSDQPPSPGPGYGEGQGQGQGPGQGEGHGHASAGGPDTPPPPPAQASGAGWPPPPPVYPAYGGGGGGNDGGNGGPAWGAPDSSHHHAPAPRRRAGGLITAIIVGALVAGGVGGGIGYWAAESNDGGSTGSTTVSAGEAPKVSDRASGTVAAVAAKALPSVVTLEAKSGDGSGDTGTGFIYDKQGHILTNNHVVASAANGAAITATFSNGKQYDAEVVGRAEGYDVAVIKLKNAPSGLTPLAIGNSDQVAVGDSTIAIGAPFGLSNTVTTGIISAKNRPVASGDETGSSNSYMSALQTDASINPGNSGGPLLDSRGAVIGMNSAIQPSGGGNGQSQAGSIGLGFAIPINQASTVAKQLIKTGQPVYPVIGATVSMGDESQAGTEGGDGAQITTQGEGGTPAVTPDGPAAKAGLKAGDVITKFNDTAIDSGPTLIGEIWTHKPGDKVNITYKRDGKQSTVQLTLGERKGDS
ncbi:S1C family serine protease [Streptomyces sp. NBC_00370]|uniref:S1C family serine protease n=2 Tax=unclassified Streptomyces TaxID=2593676 RepID=UPI002E25D524